jgi:divalent metal cation (Fe/Co/Zn/Cd) transporter
MQVGMMMGLEHCAGIPLAVSIDLVLMNWAIDEASKSVVEGAETIHNLVDFLITVAVLIGPRFLRK